MLDDFKKLLTEGVTIPVTLVVNVRFNTVVDEKLFNQLTTVGAGEKIEVQSEQPVKIATKPAETVDYWMQQEPVVESKPAAVIELPESIVAQYEPFVEPVAEPIVKIVPAVVEEAKVEEEPKVKKPVVVKEPSEDAKLWQREKIEYIKVPGELVLRYGEHDDVLIVKYEKLHFVTSWDEIDKLSKLTDEEFTDIGVLSKLGKKGKERVGLFAKYYREGVVGKQKTIIVSPIETPVVKPIEAPIETPIEKPAFKAKLIKSQEKITKQTSYKPEPTSYETIEKQLEKQKPVEKPIYKPLEDKMFMVVRGEKNLKYKTSRDILTIKYEDTTLATTWDEISRLAELSPAKLSNKVENMFKDSVPYQKTLLSFIKAYQAGRVFDPDAGFKKILNVNTRAKYGGFGGHVQGTLEEGDSSEE